MLRRRPALPVFVYGFELDEDDVMHADLEISVEVMPSAEGLPLPSYATEGAAGLDLRAALAAPLVLPPLRLPCRCGPWLQRQ